jgi:hypothetical protein
VEEPEHWWVQGPVVRGERTAMHSTSDQRLLESRGAATSLRGRRCSTVTDDADEAVALMLATHHSLAAPHPPD